MNIDEHARDSGSRVERATLVPKLRTVYLATWRGQVVYGREFQTELEAWAYLARCDWAGRIV